MTEITDSLHEDPYGFLRVFREQLPKYLSEVITQVLERNLKHNLYPIQLFSCKSYIFRNTIKRIRENIS
jgi:hypothetical protein